MVDRVWLTVFVDQRLENWALTVQSPEAARHHRFLQRLLRQSAVTPLERALWIFVFLNWVMKIKINKTQTQGDWITSSGCFITCSGFFLRRTSSSRRGMVPPSQPIADKSAGKTDRAKLASNLQKRKVVFYFVCLRHHCLCMKYEWHPQNHRILLLTSTEYYYSRDTGTDTDDDI